MSTDPLIPVQLSGPQKELLPWAEGLRCRWPQSLLDATGLAAHRDAEGVLQLPAKLSAGTSDIVEKLRLHAAFTPQSPTSSRLPFSYRSLPDWVRDLFGAVVGRWNRSRSDRWAAFPQWPLDLSADLLADLSNGTNLWRQGPTPVVLSHDLDSSEGIQRCLAQFLPLEEEHRASSTSFVVPCGWPLDHGQLDEIQRRGNEIGTHGYDHSNRTSFLDPSQRRERLAAGKRSLERYQPQGYRAPSLLRTKELLADLASFYRYDSSIPTSGGLFPVPNNGCTSARPFELTGLLEIPLSLPRDGSLLFLGYTPQEILDLWMSCTKLIRRAGGVVVLLTHCEARFSGNPAMLETYRRYLEFVASSKDYYWSTLAKISESVLPSPR